MRRLDMEMRLAEMDDWEERPEATDDEGDEDRGVEKSELLLFVAVPMGYDAIGCCCSGEAAVGTPEACKETVEVVETGVGTEGVEARDDATDTLEAMGRGGISSTGWWAAEVWMGERMDADRRWRAVVDDVLAMLSGRRRTLGRPEEEGEDEMVLELVLPEGGGDGEGLLGRDWV
jgi:hypothetical protein